METADVISPVTDNSGLPLMLTIADEAVARAMRGEPDADPEPKFNSTI
jgi:hypothetical protein